MAREDDPQLVRAEYAREERLQARASVYAGSRGEDVLDVVTETVAAQAPTAVLEVGCGTGALAQRLRDEHGLAVRAIDSSPRMVTLTRERGIAAQVADVASLPLDDASCDCVVAAWMLYHAADLDRGLAEIARVLRPGGHLIAVTNSRRHLAELWALVGLGPHELPFSAENGGAALGRHFSAVQRRDVEGVITFADRAAARVYVAASIRAPERADLLPEFTAPLAVTRASCVFTARR